MLIGNKLDLKENREVDEESAQKYAEEKNMKYLGVSAKDGLNIITMFEIMGAACVKAIKDNENKNDSTDIPKKPKENHSIKIKKSIQNTKEKRCC